MCESPKPHLLSRRTALLGGGAALLATAAGTLGTAGTAHAVSSPGGSITRDEIISRAWNWYDRGIQYNQSGHALDYERNHYYRTDCSGFVSQCWHASPYGMGTYTTRTLHEISDSISKSNMLRGDILNWYDHHCVLFRKWANTSKTRLVIYELGNTASDMNLRETYLSEFSSYTARRYRRISG